MSLYYPWWEDLDNKYHPKYSGKFLKGSKIEALTDLSAWGGTVIGEIYTVLGYNKYGTVYLEELDYRKSGYGVNNFKLVEDKMSNKELLDYAVENIESWDDKYTHLRSDYSTFSFFWSTGEWEQNKIVWHKLMGDWESAQFSDSQFKTSSPQVITKQEYLDAKEKRMKENTFIERDGKYNLEVTGEQLMLIWWFACNTTSCTAGVQDLWGKLSKLPQCDTTSKLVYQFDGVYRVHMEPEYQKLNEAFFTKPISIEEKRIQELTDTINKAQAEIEKAQEQLKGLKKV